MFERLVRSVKRCLLKGLRNMKLNFEELMTVLTEVEMVLNSRPLTYIDEDEQSQTLTPSHLFHGRRLLDVEVKGYEEDEDKTKEEFQLDRGQALRRMKHVDNTLNHFWGRWLHEYLVDLRELHKLKENQLIYK